MPRTAHRLDLTNQHFGKWLVKEFSHKNKYGEKYWSCICECGTEKTVIARSLHKGLSQSCGCVHHSLKHGKEGTKIYNIWAGMKQRCTNSKYKHFDRYGGRGIKVCQRWSESFEAFYEDMGEPPARTSIDRIDNDGDYEPSNCRWATLKQQARNKVLTSFLEYKGQRKPLAEWAEQYNLKRRILRERIASGWEVEQALLTPNRKAPKLG